MGPGEGAGVVDIGDNQAVVFKVESHNHPSAIEPYQGAATGVGGIIRDIVSIGARPINLLNSLRFGELSVKQNQRLLKALSVVLVVTVIVLVYQLQQEKSNSMNVTMEIRLSMQCV